jgi:hypothetical protein
VKTKTVFTAFVLICDKQGGCLGGLIHRIGQNEDSMRRAFDLSSSSDEQGSLHQSAFVCKDCGHPL